VPKPESWTKALKLPKTAIKGDNLSEVLIVSNGLLLGVIIGWKKLSKHNILQGNDDARPQANC
jgi:hypothetical protein